MKHTSVAVVGLGFGVAGLCCAPVGFLGAGFALLSRSEAKKANEAPSVMTVVTLVMAVLGVLTNIGLYQWFSRTQAEHKAKVEALQASLAPKLLAAELDEATACGLAKLHLGEVMHELSSDDARCAGFTPGTVARLRTEVGPDDASLRTTHFCIAKANRWFVLSTPAREGCPATGPSAPSPVPTDEAGFRAQEDQLRADEKAARGKEVVASFDLALAPAHDAVIDWLEARGALEPKNEGKLKPEPCAASVKLEGEAASVDVDALPGSTEKGWPMLSSDDAENALKPGPVATRAEAIEKLQRRGPVLAVFASTLDKTLPVGRGKSFDMGVFTGWLVLWHLDEGQVLCGVPVHFENNETVGGGVKLKFMPDKSTQKLADDDFQKEFKRAARDAVGEVSGKRLKLDLPLF